MERVEQPYNVLLISLDTTRADHIGCFGHSTIETPNIDRLAAEGTMFTQCFTPAPITLPAHCSMMTGTYPFVHGARANGTHKLHPSNETLAGTLAVAGYRTHAILASVVLDRECGMDRGFAVYDDLTLPADDQVKDDNRGAPRSGTRRTSDRRRT